MRIDRLLVQTFWTGRQELPAACAGRLLPMLRQLQSLNSAFAGWVEAVESESSPRVPAWQMPPSLIDLTAAIQKGQRMREMPQEPWPELGYAINAWNGKLNPTSVWLDGCVGGSGAELRLLNNLTLSLSPPVPDNQDLTGFGTVSQSLLTTAHSWDVLWGAVTHTHYNPPASRIDGRFSWPLGGWMTYLSAPLARDLTLPPSVMAERLPGGAVLLIATEESFDPQDPAHVAAADAIDAALAPIRQSG